MGVGRPKELRVRIPTPLRSHVREGFAAAGQAPTLVALTDERARDPSLAGAKAANLARATAAGLPVLPGFVLTTVATPGDAAGTVHAAWSAITEPGHPLVVRSSSTAEDLATSSMAGQFRSVVGVDGWTAFVDAVDAVRASGPASGAMAVLVQPQLQAVRGGVLFGLDPVTGDPRRMLVEAVADTPHRLVDGTVTATRYVLSRRGRLLEGEPEPGPPLLDRRRRVRLVRMARRAERLFGAPQDIEWAEDAAGRLWLLQARPVTATGTLQRTVGPLLGPGPVAETFPARLRPLERELWVAPMRAGIAEAIELAGAASRRRILDSPVVTVVDGWAAADLELLGYVSPHRRLRDRIDPRGPLRHLVASWRVGRLRVALPGLAADLVDGTDVALHRVPPLQDLTDGELVEVLDRTRLALVALHAHEVLAGMLVADGDGPTSASLALRALAAGRGRGEDDATILARDPVVLALSAPRIGPPRPLPDSGSTRRGANANGVDLLPPREALRLRIRWVQELGARAARELGLRWAGALETADNIPLLSLAEVRTMVAAGTVPPDVAARAVPTDATPLPAAFRFTRSGGMAPTPAGNGGGRAAGGGRSIGTVRQLDDLDALLSGDVLVVRTLDPELAPHLGQLGGLVAEAGSALSHLAILAREAGVPTVVGVPDACRRFPSGTAILVDGTAGVVERVGGVT